MISKTFLRTLSTAAENAKIIDSKAPNVNEQLWKVFLKLEKVNDNRFRSINLLKGRRSFEYIYGGQVFAHSLKSACKTVDPKLHPHSMHGYFIKAGSVEKPVDYLVDRVRDGKSFSTRLVKAVQDGEVLFTSQISFQVKEKGSFDHAPTIQMPEIGPENLKSTRTRIRERIEEDPEDVKLSAKLFLKFKYAEFPKTFHGIFETRPVDQNVYNMSQDSDVKNPKMLLWVRPTIPIGNNPHMQRLLAAYFSDSTMIETAIIPHLSRGYIPGSIFSLDHCIWFHNTEFNMDNWMLWEQVGEYAGHNRTFTKARLFSRDGQLIMSAQQEGLARAARQH